MIQGPLRFRGLVFRNVAVFKWRKTTSHLQGWLCDFCDGPGMSQEPIWHWVQGRQLQQNEWTLHVTHNVEAGMILEREEFLDSLALFHLWPVYWRFIGKYRLHHDLLYCHPHVLPIALSVGKSNDRHFAPFDSWRCSSETDGSLNSSSFLLSGDAKRLSLSGFITKFSRSDHHFTRLGAVVTALKLFFPPQSPKTTILIAMGEPTFLQSFRL